jgi:hypothetical protein
LGPTASKQANWTDTHGSYHCNNMGSLVTSATDPNNVLSRRSNRFTCTVFTVIFKVGAKYAKN